MQLKAHQVVHVSVTNAVHGNRKCELTVGDKHPDISVLNVGFMTQAIGFRWICEGLPAVSAEDGETIPSTKARWKTLDVVFHIPSCEKKA